MKKNSLSYQCLVDATNMAPKRQNGIEELEDYIHFESFRDILNKHCQTTKSTDTDASTYDVVTMFKIIILQALYNFSDEETAYHLSDRISFMRFCGIDPHEPIPNASAICNFKAQLGDKGTLELFNSFAQQILEAGLMFSEGSITDASFKKVPQQSNTPDESN